jgi:hypothetical protein
MLSMILIQKGEGWLSCAAILFLGVAGANYMRVAPT